MSSRKRVTCSAHQQTFAAINRHKIHHITGNNGWPGEGNWMGSDSPFLLPLWQWRSGDHQVSCTHTHITHQTDLRYLERELTRVNQSYLELIESRANCDNHYSTKAIFWDSLYEIGDNIKMRFIICWFSSEIYCMYLCLDDDILWSSTTLRNGEERGTNWQLNLPQYWNIEFAIISRCCPTFFINPLVFIFGW